MPSVANEYTLPVNFTPQKQQLLFEEIVRLYDLADDVLATVSQSNVTNRGAQLELVKPVITQVTNSANIVSAFYTEVVRNERPITRELQDTFETALQNIFTTVKEFADHSSQKILTAPSGRFFSGSVQAQLEKIAGVMPAAHTVLLIHKQAEHIQRELEATRMAASSERVQTKTEYFSQSVRAKAPAAVQEVPTLVQPSRAKLVADFSEHKAELAKKGEDGIISLVSLIKNRRAAAMHDWASRRAA